MADDLRPNRKQDLEGADQPPRERLLTVEEFFRLGDLGFLEEPGKHELWDGRIVVTPPAGPSHMDCERRVVRALVLAIERAGLSEQFGVQPGGGVRIGKHNFRAPDVMIVRLPFDTENLPTGESVALVIEIALTSLPFDLTEKRSKYAGAGIAEYWVIDVRRRRLHPFRNPKGGDYSDCEPLETGAAISPLFAPQITLNVADLV